MANTDQALEWIEDNEITSFELVIKRHECCGRRDIRGCVSYEPVLGGGFMPVREDICYHAITKTLRTPSGYMYERCLNCSKLRKLQQQFTDEELDFVRAFNSRQG